MRTLKCVNAEEMKQFFSSSHAILNGSNAMDRIAVTDSIFDFTHTGDDGEKMLEGFSLDALNFERCIITGSLFIKHSNINLLSFNHCVFIEPEFMMSRQDFKSLRLSNVAANELLIENSVFSDPIVVYGGAIKRSRFNYVTCPRLYLQSMNPLKSTLSIHRFLGKKVYLPQESTFEQIWVDYFTFSQLTGRKELCSVQEIRD